MKQFLTFLVALLFAFANCMAMPSELDVAVAEVRAAINAAEIAALKSQSLEELNEAAQAQVVRELKLTGAKRKEFETLYRSYRAALDKAVCTTTGVVTNDQLKAKLSNIAATAQVKRDYVDRFAKILTAEQIRTLYNTEGQIATSIKSAVGRRSQGRLRGSGRLVTQDWGKVGDYTSISTSSFVKVTVSATARTVSVTADDNVIDYVEMARENGGLKFRLNASQTQDISVSIVVPSSSSLASVSAGSFGKIICQTPLTAADVQVATSSYGVVEADIVCTGKASVKISSYGTFTGSVQCEDCNYVLSSYASGSGSVVCRDLCDMNVSSYASFSDPVKAKNVNLQISSYASFKGSLMAADETKLSVGSYATFSGDITSQTTVMSGSSGASIRSAFTGSSLRAEVGSYSKIVLSGAAKVNSAIVEIASSGSFSASELQVVDYTLTASAYASASVWCSGVLHVNAATSATVKYDGPCRVESFSPNIKRR